MAHRAGTKRTRATAVENKRRKTSTEAKASPKSRFKKPSSNAVICEMNLKTKSSYENRRAKTTEKTKTTDERPRRKNNNTRKKEAKGITPKNNVDRLPPTTTDQSSQRKPKKSSTKAIKKSDREELLQSLNNIEEKFLLCEVNNELRATFDDDGLLKDFTNVLCSSDQLLRDIAVHHQHCFGALYVSSKMEQDAFTHFQFEWYKYCSVFLLSQEYTL